MAPRAGNRRRRASHDAPIVTEAVRAAFGQRKGRARTATADERSMCGPVDAGLRGEHRLRRTNCCTCGLLLNGGQTDSKGTQTRQHDDQEHGRYERYTALPRMIVKQPTHGVLTTCV